MRRSATLALAALAATFALATGVASAATATFGANLARVPNNMTSCASISGTNCSVLSVNPVTGESSFPPVGEGIVSAVRVRVGPVTGPMQIVVEQALRQDNPFEPGKPNYACCQVMAMSQVFTPTANAITTVPVNFRVRQDITPDANGYYVDQHLSLSVLNPNVPIPAASDPNASMTLWFPAWQAVGEQRAGPAGGSGATILMNADWDPVGGSGTGVVTPPPPPPPPPPPLPALTLPQRIRPVVNNRALIPLVCGLDRACVGRLLLQSRQAGGAAARVSALAASSASDDAAVSAKKKGNKNRKGKRGKKGKNKKGKRRTITYASVKFRVPAGKRKTIRAVLRKTGKRLLKQHKQAKVWLNVRMDGAEVEPEKITLKRGSSKQGKKGKGGKKKAAKNKQSK